MEILLSLLGIGFVFLYVLYIRSSNNTQEIKPFPHNSYSNFQLSLSPPSHIFIAESAIPNAGRGVFASQNIQSGELIENCPVIEFSSEESPWLKVTQLRNYVYAGDKEKKSSALCFGYGSLYNHAASPNATWGYLPKQGIIQFRATKKIQKGEEITINYGWDPRKRDQKIFGIF